MLHSRSKRIEESLKQALQRIFHQEIKDHRLPAIFTISKVTVAKDLRNATIGYSQLPDDEDALADTAEMLEDCAAFVRKRLAEEVNLKHTPHIHFVYDPGEKNYQRVNTLLQDLKRKGELAGEEFENSKEEER